MESFTRWRFSGRFIRSGMVASTAALLTSSLLRTESREVAQIFDGNLYDTDEE